ncbi:hypothetical protein, unlikely [Trypanosoma brucei gambiense DAL972]|uniref:Uncharacterized protein n=1 Tax=Trypanosoma brucei gambiense (strain MHOM/CI/86/DAL972) TaxID=679716 RepID=C9ZIR6_TRYB9|nr:hypothetical protein, unlikely [Trypanosoma brucei gambiense DAL972]CBH09058.1 hypothetical protein, unlikely [Trypanosoma brucei gambiense DAL972]|eukprot:XP_011771499.1 hypothetical protein, unlikely [Trypanosoma brucei gambiense DAL972]
MSAIKVNFRNAQTHTRIYIYIYTDIWIYTKGVICKQKEQWQKKKRKKERSNVDDAKDSLLHINQFAEAHTPCSPSCFCPHAIIRDIIKLASLHAHRPPVRSNHTSTEYIFIYLFICVHIHTYVCAHTCIRVNVKVLNSLQTYTCKCINMHA